MTGCTYNSGSKSVTLSASYAYGNVTVRGGTTMHMSKGTHALNSLTLSGKSTPCGLGARRHQPAGASLSGGNPIVDVSGGSIQNLTCIPANLQFAYGGPHV